MKEIEKWEGRYFITENGKVWSSPKKPQNPKGRFLKTFFDHSGYPKVSIKYKGKTYNHSVHRLVAEAFIPNPSNLPQVNHKNGIKNDNRLGNLEWCSASDNKLHSFRIGLEKNHVKGENHKNAKLSNKEAFAIKYKEQGNFRDISKKYSVSASLIERIRKNLAWKHI